MYFFGSEEKSSEYCLTYDGYEIITNKQIIKIGMTTKVLCCENFGYFLIEDKTDDFINATLLNITLTDSLLNTKDLHALEDIEHANTIFINIETSKGTFQITLYNEHNGYYSHDCIITSEKIIVSNLI